MSDESIRVPELSDDENVTVNLLAKQLKDRSRRNGIRTALYDGKSSIRQVSSVIPPQYYRLDLALGWAAKGVDGLARRCHLEDVVWTQGDIESLGLQELKDSNFLMSELSQARTDSLIHGVSYLITTKGDRSEGEPAALVHAKSALDATGEWNSRRRRLDNLLSVTSRDKNRITGFVLYLDGVTINADLNGRKWDVERSEHPWGVPVDALVYHPRTSRRMGRSRITRPAMSHQGAAVRALVRLEAHMDIYSIPKLILLGAKSSMFRNADGSMKSEWQVALGRVFGIPDDEDAANPRADVKQFDAVSPQPHLAQLNALAKLEAREFDLPDSDFALTDLANPTSEGSYYAGRDNLLAEADGAKEDWSVPTRRTVTRALAIQNGMDGVPDEWASIDTKWRDSEHLSKASVADAGAKQLAAGPDWLKETEVGLELLGLSRQQIDRAMAEKRRAQALVLRTGVAAEAGAQYVEQANAAGGR